MSAKVRLEESRKRTQSEPGKLVGDAAGVKLAGAQGGVDSGIVYHDAQRQGDGKKGLRSVKTYAVKTADFRFFLALTFPQPARNISCP